MVCKIQQLWLTRFKIKTYILPTLHLYDLKHETLISFFLQKLSNKTVKMCSNWKTKCVQFMEEFVSPNLFPSNFENTVKMCSNWKTKCVQFMEEFVSPNLFQSNFENHSMHAFRFGGNYTRPKCWKLNAQWCQNFGNSKPLSRLCLRSIISLFL
jgi:patatin-like phospholipase/acyl hydrolase